MVLVNFRFLTTSTSKNGGWTPSLAVLSDWWITCYRSCRCQCLPHQRWHDQLVDPSSEIIGLIIFALKNPSETQRRQRLHGFGGTFGTYILYPQHKQQQKAITKENTLKLSMGIHFDAVWLSWINDIQCLATHSNLGSARLTGAGGGSRVSCQPIWVDSQNALFGIDGIVPMSIHLHHYLKKATEKAHGRNPPKWSKMDLSTIHIDDSRRCHLVHSVYLN